MESLQLAGYQRATPSFQQQQQQQQQQHHANPSVSVVGPPRCNLLSQDSTLCLRLLDGGLVASPPCAGPFGFAWSGARCGVGITNGRYHFTVTVLKQLEPAGSLLCPELVSTPAVRVGVSTAKTDVAALGESTDSWAACSDGSICKGPSSFQPSGDYRGSLFGVGDKVTTCVDMSSPVASIAFSVNGRWLGKAYDIDKANGSLVLIPHILVRNMEVRVDFEGISLASPPPPQMLPFRPWQGAASIPAHHSLTPSLRSSSARQQLFILVGLPGSGKTTWAAQYAQQHPECTVVGVAGALDQMRAAGLSRRPDLAADRRAHLNLLATAMFEAQLAEATKQPRAYVIDQGNVSEAGVRARVASFPRASFRRVAAVIVQPDAELLRRQAAQASLECKYRSEASLLQLRATFVLPVVGPDFDDVLFLDAPQPVAQSLLAAMRPQAQEALSRIESSKRPGGAPGPNEPASQRQRISTSAGPGGELWISRPSPGAHPGALQNGNWSQQKRGQGYSTGRFNETSAAASAAARPWSDAAAAASPHVQSWMQPLSGTVAQSLPLLTSSYKAGSALAPNAPPHGSYKQQQQQQQQQGVQQGVQAEVRVQDQLWVPPTPVGTTPAPAGTFGDNRSGSQNSTMALQGEGYSRSQPHQQHYQQQLQTSQGAASLQQLHGDAPAAQSSGGPQSQQHHPGVYASQQQPSMTDPSTPSQTWQHGAVAGQTSHQSQQAYQPQQQQTWPVASESQVQQQWNHGTNSQATPEQTASAQQQQQQAGSVQAQHGGVAGDANRGGTWAQPAAVDSSSVQGQYWQSGAAYPAQSANSTTAASSWQAGDTQHQPQQQPPQYHDQQTAEQQQQQWLQQHGYQQALPQQSQQTGQAGMHVTAGTPSGAASNDATWHSQQPQQAPLPTDQVDFGNDAATHMWGSAAQSNVAAYGGSWHDGSLVYSSAQQAQGSGPGQHYNGALATSAQQQQPAQGVASTQASSVHGQQQVGMPDLTVETASAQFQQGVSGDHAAYSTQANYQEGGYIGVPQQLAGSSTEGAYHYPSQTSQQPVSELADEASVGNKAAMQLQQNGGGQTQGSFGSAPGLATAPAGEWWQQQQQEEALKSTQVSTSGGQEGVPQWVAPTEPYNPETYVAYQQYGQAYADVYYSSYISPQPKSEHQAQPADTTQQHQQQDVKQEQSSQAYSLALQQQQQQQTWLTPPQQTAPPVQQQQQTYKQLVAQQYQHAQQGIGAGSAQGASAPGLHTGGSDWYPGMQNTATPTATAVGTAAAARQTATPTQPPGYGRGHGHMGNERLWLHSGAANTGVGAQAAPLPREAAHSSIQSNQPRSQLVVNRPMPEQQRQQQNTARQASDASPLRGTNASHGGRPPPPQPRPPNQPPSQGVPTAAQQQQQAPPRPRPPLQPAARAVPAAAAAAAAAAAMLPRGPRGPGWASVAPAPAAGPPRWPVRPVGGPSGPVGGPSGPRPSATSAGEVMSRPPPPRPQPPRPQPPRGAPAGAMRPTAAGPPPPGRPVGQLWQQPRRPSMAAPQMRPGLLTPGSIPRSGFAAGPPPGGQPLRPAAGVNHPGAAMIRPGFPHVPGAATWPRRY